MKKKSFDNFLFDIFVSKKKKEVVVRKNDIPDKIQNVITNIDIIFTNNDIDYQIPFVYKKDNDFKNLKIVVNNLYTPQQLCDLLDVNEYRIDKEFLDVNYKGVNITFILTPPENFVITYWYYSWDILSTLMNVLFDGMGLRFDKDGLKYVHKGIFLLSTNIEEIVEFLGLNFNQYKAGFFTLENEIDYIMNSSIFDADKFFNYQLNPKDHFYNENIILFKKALEKYEPFRDSTGNFKFSDDKDTYLTYIVEYFYESGILEKMSLIVKKK